MQPRSGPPPPARAPGIMNIDVEFHIRHNYPWSKLPANVKQVRPPPRGRGPAPPSPARAARGVGAGSWRGAPARPPARLSGKPTCSPGTRRGRLWGPRNGTGALLRRVGGHHTPASLDALARSLCPARPWARRLRNGFKARGPQSWRRVGKGRGTQGDAAEASRSQRT